MSYSKIPQIIMQRYTAYNHLASEVTLGVFLMYFVLSPMSLDKLVKLEEKIMNMAKYCFHQFLT